MSLVNDYPNMIASLQTMLNLNGFSLTVSKAWDAATDSAWEIFSLSIGMRYRKGFPPDVYELPKAMLAQVEDAYLNTFGGAAAQEAYLASKNNEYNDWMKLQIARAYQDKRKVAIVDKIIESKQQDPRRVRAGPLMGPGGSLTWNPRQIAQIEPGPAKEGLDRRIKLR